MSDLTSLMKYAPGTAGFMIGQNNSQAMQSEALKQEELKQLIAQRLQQMEQEKQMNPLKMEHQRLQNEGLSAGLPGITADSQLKQLNQQFTQATQASAIEAAKSKDANLIDENKFKAISRFKDWSMQTGLELEGTPPVLRKQALFEKMQAAGINQNNPMAQNLVKDLDGQDPTQWPAYFMKLSDKLGQMTANQSPQYRASTENNVRDNTQRNIDSQRREATARYTADKGAESRLAVARERGAAKGAGGADFWSSYYKTKGALNKFNALTSEAAKLAQGDDDDKAEAQKLLIMREALRDEATAELNMRRNPAAVNPNTFVEGAAAEPLSLGPKPAASAQVTPPTGKTRSGASYTIIKE